VQVYAIIWKEMKPVEDGRKEWLHASSTDFKLQIPLHNRFWPTQQLYRMFLVKIQNFL